VANAPARRDLGLLFDAVADDYLAVRPRYPDRLFDDLASIAELGDAARVLEIGCGPGIATVPLLDRRWQVVAIEPGRSMAGLAAERGRGRPLRVEQSTFEEWAADGERFSLVFSATAFHWVDPAVRFEKAAAVLEDGGHLALVTNRTVEGGGFARLYEASRNLHERHARDLADEGPAPSADALIGALEGAAGDIGLLWAQADPKGGVVPAGELFEPPVLRTYRWEEAYRPADAVRLLSTYSPYLALPAAERDALFAGIRRIIDERFDGVVTRPYLSVLAVARRVSG